MAANRRTRTYESPLRAEQMDRTREKLIDAGIDLVAEAGGEEELTVRRVAARAGVSVPTAYRHFPDRDALFEGMARWIHDRIGGARPPESVDDMPAWARVIYKNFEANDRVMRAQLYTPAGRLLRTRNQKARVPLFLEMANQGFPDATAATQTRITAVINLLVTVTGWVALHDNYNMSGAEIGETSAWAIETLLAELRRNPHALEFDVPDAAPAATPPAATPPARAPRPRTGAAKKKSR
jgi:AcrR family transcriptional regulator